jgi:hypothetical protein
MKHSQIKKVNKRIARKVRRKIAKIKFSFASFFFHLFYREIATGNKVSRFSEWWAWSILRLKRAKNAMRD